MSKTYKVSVVVLTYNPHLEKLKLTLKSILLQKDISFQIVVSDDGSANDKFEEIKEYFEQEKFVDYQLLKRDKNGGTVANLTSAIATCEGEYIKAISPGDMLYGDTMLTEWYHLCITNQCKYSFSNCVYYHLDSESNKIEFLKEYSFPQNISVYKCGDINRFRNNYLLLDDVCVGAAAFCEKNIYYDYLLKIVDKVFYGEDNMWRLMAFDGIKFIWFDCNAVLYEFGTGISTKKDNTWTKKLVADWITTDQMILNKIQIHLNRNDLSKTDISFMQKLSLYINAKNVGGEWRTKRIISMPWTYSLKIKKALHLFKKTPIEVKSSFLNQLGLR